MTDLRIHEKRQSNILEHQLLMGVTMGVSAIFKTTYNHIFKAINRTFKVHRSHKVIRRNPVQSKSPLPAKESGFFVLRQSPRQPIVNQVGNR